MPPPIMPPSFATCQIGTSQRQQDRSGAGQSHHPYGGVAVCRLHTGRSTPSRRAVRVALHAETRQLADMAESELGVLSSQCLDRRIEDKDSLIQEVAAWQAHRNKHHAKANWQFTNEQGRVKLRRLYPSL